MRVLIIGSSASVRADLGRIQRSDFDSVIGVNQAAIEFGPVDFHITLHPDQFAYRKAGRMVSYRNELGVDEVFDWRWPQIKNNSGSSGLYAVKYALDRLNADYIVLAGIGMDESPHFDGRPWKDFSRYRKAWPAVLPAIKGKVYSLSGWTAKLLGEPNDPTA